MSNRPIIKPVNKAGHKPRRNPMIKTAIMAKPIEPPFGKTPLKMMPCNSSMTKPRAANMPTSHSVLTNFDVFFITLPLKENPQYLVEGGNLKEKSSLR